MQKRSCQELSEWKRISDDAGDKDEVDEDGDQYPALKASKAGAASPRNTVGVVLGKTSRRTFLPVNDKDDAKGWFC